MYEAPAERALELVSGRAREGDAARVDVSLGGGDGAERLAGQASEGASRMNEVWPRALDVRGLDGLELLERLPAALAVADRAARRRAEEVFEFCLA